MEADFVAPSHSALAAAGWAKLWMGEVSHLFEKLLVVLGDLEGLCASFAGFGCWHFNKLLSNSTFHSTLFLADLEK